MRSSGSVPGASGIALIIFVSLVAAAAITQVTGSVSHWPIVIAGILVGLLAARSVR